MDVPSLPHDSRVFHEPTVILNQNLENPEYLGSQVHFDPVPEYPCIREVDPERAQRDFSCSASHDASLEIGTFLEK
jgi:hypothetical protein